MPKEKIILKGELELVSPAIIGSGESERSDLDVIKDSEGRPFIPATSFVGVLRHMIKPKGIVKNKLDLFWGAKDLLEHENMVQSSLVCYDLLALDYSLALRDGVSIDNKKGVAKQHAKFDYEIIERGSRFELCLEINIDGEDDEAKFKKQMLATIIKLLQEERVHIGAKTNNGFGRVKLIKYDIYCFDFSKSQDVISWFKYLQSGILPASVNLDVEALEFSKNQFIVEAGFTIRNSLVIRSYNIEPNMPDTEHIKSNDEYVLPGSSLKGAIRARAEKILNTLDKDIGIINELFGMVDEKSKKAKKGRLMVEETLLPGFPSEVQTRIKIDRFTGGALEAALLQTKPLFSRDECVFNLRMTIDDYKDYEAGLMLLVLKDLWTGDLPVGGEKAIGRGVLQGIKAEVGFAGRKIIIEDPREISRDDKKILQEFVEALVSYGGVL